MLYIHNTTEMVAMLDGGNGGKEQNTEGGGWGVVGSHRLQTAHGLVLDHLLGLNFRLFCL